MKVIQNIFLLGVLCSLFSCKEAEFMPYKDVDRIQFGPMDPAKIYWSDYEKIWKLSDTAKAYSFYTEEATKLVDTVYFRIYTLGKVQNYDRAFKLMQSLVKDVDNAVPNKHYQAFDDSKGEQLYVVKAGQSYMRVPVVLLRDASLKSKPYTLQFEVVANEHFQQGAPTNTWRRVLVGDLLLQPAAWDDYATKYFWGKYSRVKHEFMIEVTGLKWDQEMMSKLEFDQSKHFGTELKKELALYNNAHLGEPKVDEFGDLIVFP